MAYSSFTDLTALAREFGLDIVYQASLFDGEYHADPSAFLIACLDEFEPLALSIGTEKARSEFLIAPILAEIRRRCDVTLFSGIDFSVDAAHGLSGFCDYLLSRDPNPYSLQAPVFAAVEAKKEEINSGLGQCAAEMVAAQRFNERKGNQIPALYGAVTTGELWRFLKLTDNRLEIDRDNEALHPIGRLLGILSAIARGEA